MDIRKWLPKLPSEWDASGRRLSREEMKTMKILILAMIAAAFMLAQDKDSKAGKEPVGIPKGATQVAPNLYRATDAQGKTWFYRQSPFGISKWEDKPEVQRTVAEPLTTVHDLGDKVEFQRQTPFGVSKWVTK